MNRQRKFEKIIALLENLNVKYEIQTDSGSLQLYLKPQISMSENNNRYDRYDPKYFEICIDEKEYVFMQIDDYQWEFDENFERALPEIDKYVKAFVSDRLVQKTMKIGPFVFNRKLEIKS